MQPSEKHIQELKGLIEEKEGKVITWEEAADAARNLMGLAEICFDQWREDCRRKKKLEESPKGFELDGVGYTCAICGHGTQVGDNWYDKWGIKCKTCQRAIGKKIIPRSCAKRKNSWYSSCDLESCFGLNHHARKRFIKEGYLKARIVPSESGKPHAYLFLIKDNKDTLPPKKLTESKLVKETRDGKDWYRSEPWYRFGDPYEHLKGYKILEYLTFTEHGKK